MFERLKNALSARRASLPDDEGLHQWAMERMLAHVPRQHGGYAIAGQWMDQPFRAECAPSAREYIKGFELKAKAELGLTHEVHLILMNRALKRTFEAQANKLYENVTDALQTTAKQLPEEVRWLSMYRDAGWPGPDDRFWARYAVLTDAPEIARHCLDDQTIELLMDWPEDVNASTPMLFMLMRGNIYLRMQVDQPADSEPVLHALDVFEHFSVRAMTKLGR
ncbi:MAG: hypothetical protein C0453_14180 [Comamonadaceae bacterium]|nr:hypothetical protein [Comamonadaceae bacterium]